jgi:tetratricopeptide (TPR) repeat protein
MSYPILVIRSRAILPALALLVAGAVTRSETSARAAGADPWVGARVMARSSETRLKVGARVTARLNAGSVFRVDRAQGEWLWVDSGNIRGWVKKADVVALDAAEAFFTGVIARDRAAGYAYLSRGIARHARKESEAAVADFTEAIRLDPKDVWAYHNRAAACYARGDFSRALDDADAAVRLDPEEAAHRANRAGIRYALKQFDEAVADYTEAIRLARGDEASLEDAGDEGDPARTRGRLLIAKWTCARADCWAARGAPEKAAADYAEAVRLDPLDAATMNSLAWLLATCADARVRDGLHAFALAARACELTGYRSHLCLDTLAAAYAEAGDFVAAVRWQSAALQLAANDPHAADVYRARMKLFREKLPYRERPAN